MLSASLTRSQPIEGAGFATPVAAIWARARELTAEHDIDLDLRLNGRPEPLPHAADELLRFVASTVLESVASSSIVQHLAIDLSYEVSSVRLRVEHDGALAPTELAAAEASLLARYSEAGPAGASLAVSSGRGFGLRAELVLPNESNGEVDAAQLRMGPAPAAGPVGGRAMAAPVLAEPLTPQEEVCLSLLSAGFSNKEIAARMHLSVGTVKYHLAQVYQKLGVQGRGRTAAVARARELGLIFD